MEPTTLEVIVQALVGLATVVLTVIVAPLVLKQVKVADGKLSEQQRDVLYPILLNAIAWGQAAVLGDEEKKLASVAEIQNTIVDLGVRYTRLSAPLVLEQLEVTDEALRRMLLARLQQAIQFAQANVPGMSDRDAAVAGSALAASTPAKS